MAVTVGVLEGMYGAGKFNPSVDGMCTAGVSGLGWPESQQEFHRRPHFRSTSFAGTSKTAGDWGAQGLQRFSPHHALDSTVENLLRHHASDSIVENLLERNAPVAEVDGWQTQRQALESTIENLLQKVLPGSIVPAPYFPFLQQSGKQSTMRNEYMTISAPPGLELPSTHLQNDANSVVHTASAFRAPPGLCIGHDGVQPYSDAWDVIQDAPKFENCKSHVDSTKFNSTSTDKSTCTDSTSDEGVERDGRRTLLIAYFPRGTTEDGLQSVFEEFGIVQTVNMVKDKTGSHMCYGFVRFGKASAAETAYNTCQKSGVVMHDSTGKSWYLKASWARNAYGKGKGGKRARGQKIAQLADK